MNRESRLETIKGVGVKTAEILASAGLHTVSDLLTFFPRTYEDYSNVTTIAALLPGKVSLKGRFEQVSTRRVRRGMSVTEATLIDETGKVAVVWFNQSYRVAQIQKNDEFLVSGEFGLQRGRYQLTNPSVELADHEAASSGRIVPVYRQVGGLKSTMVRKLLFELRPLMLALPETLPSVLVKHENLMSYADAVHALHFPSSGTELNAAKDRMGFEELLALLLAAQQNRDANEALAAHEIVFSAADAKDFVSHLPFQLTDAQRIAAWEAIQNLASGMPMNRLLQGDVGSGKTVVAGLVAYIAHKAGFQSALLAPTELLASQHAETLASLLAPFEVSVGLLTGSVKASAKKLLKAQIASGLVHVVVGTHALLEDDVGFARLGFVVIDEQHRFGVEQRQKLLLKSDKMPHMLAMTATPIPRSLQLTVYGELDISLLSEKPKNRQPIETHIISPNSRAQMYTAVEQQIIAGRQVYVVCPRIEEGVDELASVQAELKRLKGSVFKNYRLGLLHGKLKSDEKNAVMQSFAAGEIDVLVSTTVVEVGVDAPNATAIIIEGAERFGLAQLHQLRGRVGRSDLRSFCYLVTSTSQAPSRRLRELERSNDGFYLAEKDLELRGPGEIYGRMQHGELNLNFARITDTQLLYQVQKAVRWLRSQKIAIADYPALDQAVQQYRRLTTLN